MRNEIQCDGLLRLAFPRKFDAADAAGSSTASFGAALAAWVWSTTPHYIIYIGGLAEARIFEGKFLKRDSKEKVYLSSHRQTHVSRTNSASFFARAARRLISSANALQMR